MGCEKKLIGQIGEDHAQRFLAENGYRILARNYRTVFGEIDIVAKKDALTIFVEVKTRATSSLGPPYLSVTRLKARQIVRNALAYLKRYGLIDSFWRIDVVSVKLDNNYGLENIELIENAIEGDYL